MIIDTHIHGDSRSSEDFQSMYTSGIDKAITCTYYPYKLRNNTCLLNHFDRIRKFDTKRALNYGLELEVALGIHPVNSIKDYKTVLTELENLINENKIKIIGEIGLEKNTPLEREIFEKQLQLADKTNTKVIIHTPRKRKEEILINILEIIRENIKEELVVIDHVNTNIAPSLVDFKGMLGLTVQPQKMTSDEAINILNTYGFDKFLLNSDISNKPSNPLSVVETVRKLKKIGYSEKNIDKVGFKNAKKFFKI